MVLETLALIALWKLATRSSKKKVLVRRRRRSTAGSVFALSGWLPSAPCSGRPARRSAQRAHKTGAPAMAMPAAGATTTPARF